MVRGSGRTSGPNPSGTTKRIAISFNVLEEGGTIANIYGQGLTGGILNKTSSQSVNIIEHHLDGRGFCTTSRRGNFPCSRISRCCWLPDADPPSKASDCDAAVLRSIGTTPQRPAIKAKMASP